MSTDASISGPAWLALSLTLGQPGCPPKLCKMNDSRKRSVSGWRAAHKSVEIDCQLTHILLMGLFLTPGLYV